MQSLCVSFKATTTVSHSVNVGRGSDEVSPGSHLWFARSSSRVLSSGCSLDRRVPLADEGERHFYHKTCSVGRPSRQSSGGRPTLALAVAGPKNRLSGIPVGTFNIDLNDNSSEVSWTTCSTTCWRSGRGAQRWLVGGRGSRLVFDSVAFQAVPTTSTTSWLLLRSVATQRLSARWFRSFSPSLPTVPRPVLFGQSSSVLFLFRCLLRYASPQDTPVPLR